LSLKRAAGELNVTPAAISHQVKALENYLGVQLFRRRNRGLELTSAARAGLPKLRDGFEALALAVAQMAPERDAGQLTVSSAPSFAARWLMPRLHRFFAARPDVDFRISARTRLNRRGDDTAVERATVESWLEDSEIAILYGHGDYAGYRVDKLFDLTVAPMCSPRLAQGAQPLRVPEDLKYQSLVHDDTGLLYDGISFWDLWLRAAGVENVDTTRGSHFSQPVLAIEAASDALGVVATLPVLAQAEIQAGSLILPFAHEAALQSAYYLVSSKTSSLRPVAGAFRDWLLAEARQK